jgi:hypothetical protein
MSKKTIFNQIFFAFWNFYSILINEVMGDIKRDGCAMKKIIMALFTIICFFVFAFSQVDTAATGSDSLKAIQKSGNASLSKKTITKQQPPTNWSKIKDLFR